MILVTWLPRITVALYGRPLSETPILRPVSALTEDIRPTPLPPYLSFSQATSPTALASSLCSECVGDVSTFHILRLMFLLKPTDTDWELPNYPVKYADITSLPELVDGSVGDHVHPRQRWLEEIMDELRFPVHDDETKDTIQLLAEPLGIAFDDPVCVISKIRLILLAYQLIECDQACLAFACHFKSQQTPSSCVRCSVCVSFPFSYFFC